MAHDLTLCLIKPNAVAKHAIGQILARFEAAGFVLRGLRLTRLSSAQAERFYEVHRGKPFYAGLVEFMTSGPIVALVLQGPDAVARARELMGATDPAKAAPGTIRRDFADSLTANAVHGSDSDDNAAREIAFFFAAADL